MSAFDFGNNSNSCFNGNVSNASNNSKGIKDECLIAFKVYDFFRLQECLTVDDLGFSRAYETSTLGNMTFEAGDIIVPPADADSVSIEDIDIQSVNVLSKKKNTFRNGYYDVNLQFVFVYKLVFTEAGGCPVGSIVATNTFTTMVTLFGSMDTDVNLSTDLFGGNGGGCSNSVTLDANPFIWVESKAIVLAADFVYPCPCQANSDVDPTAVRVTIGLFAIIKLFRIVNLLVQSKGFCIPDEVDDIAATDPCEFFDNLDFPMDSFAPPQKPEFLAGISSNIPASKCETESESDNCDCGCGCNCGCNCGCGCGRS